MDFNRTMSESLKFRTQDTFALSADSDEDNQIRRVVEEDSDDDLNCRDEDSPTQHKREFNVT